MGIGDKLKTLREHYGYSQNELAKILNIPQRSISNYENIEDPTVVLEYIVKFCDFFRLSVSELFLEKVENLKKELPDYITPTDAAILKILNGSVDIKTRVMVKQIFVDVMKAILINYEGKLGHLPEFKELFKNVTLYDQPEEEIHGLGKVADKKD